jgi:hypothetical protein
MHLSYPLNKGQVQICMKVRLCDLLYINVRERQTFVTKNDSATSNGDEAKELSLICNDVYEE